MLHKRDKFFARKTAELWKLEDTDWEERMGKSLSLSRRSTVCGYHRIMQNSGWQIAYDLGRANAGFSKAVDSF